MRSHAGAVLAAVAATGVAAAQSAPCDWEILDLTELAAGAGVVQSEGRGVAPDGTVVGFEALPNFLERAIVWHPDGTVELPPGLAGDNSTLGLGVTPDARPLGASELVTVVSRGITKIFIDQKATYWDAGQPVDLNTLVTSWPGTPFDLRRATGADSAGRIVGTGWPMVGPPFPSMGFLFDGGAITELGTLNRPQAISDAGAVVGWDDSGQDRAWLWDGGTLVDLGSDPGLWNGVSRAWDVNDAELIVGEAKWSAPAGEEPTVWINRVPQRLFPNIVRPQGIATGVNRHGMVVGFVTDLDQVNSGWRGFLWQNGNEQDLLPLLSDSKGFTQLLPYDVNDFGWIVGGGVRNGTLGHGFLMRPVTPPAVYCTAKTNSAGCTPAATFSGGVAASFTAPDPFVLSVQDVLPNKNGLFFYSLSGRAALPFLGGTLCAQPPLRRTPIQNAGGSPPPPLCSGSLAFDFNAWIQAGSDPAVTPGSLADGQFWTRDPAHPDGTGAGLSDAVEFPVCP